ncbi:unnamed protein product [Penicillium glandicola]
MEIFQPRSNKVENRGPLLLIIYCTVTGLAAIVVCLRVISRTFIVKSFGLDDWVMVTATIVAIMNVVAAVFSTPSTPYMTILSLT